jgi:hypothetical protein
MVLHPNGQPWCRVSAPEISLLLGLSSLGMLHVSHEKEEMKWCV